MSREYDPEVLSEELEDLEAGDRVGLRWQTRVSGVPRDATGDVVDDPEYHLRIERDRRDDVVAHDLNDGSIMVSTVFDGARTTEGELVDVRVHGLAESDSDTLEDDRDGQEPAADGGAGEEDQDHEPDVGEEPAPDQKPAPPASAPKYVREGLDRQDPETLRAIAAYAEELASWKEAETERELEERAADVDDEEVPEEWDADDWSEALESTSAPSRATLTKKEIDGRLYYYYQWREGDSITSEYVAPVNPAGSGED